VIALDAHGADRGPGVLIEGARAAGLPVIAFGPATDPAELPAGSEVVECPSIDAAAEPAMAVRSNPRASVVQAAVAVGEGRAAGLVSAGSTGAALAASLFHVKRIRGVHRPAIAVLLPLPGGRTLLLDAGANAEVRPEHLVQFAHMGAAFMEVLHGARSPRVGLLSVGEEPGKGTPDVVEAHRRLAGGELNFVGNVEGNDLVQGTADVVVTDGFTGNVALKTMEGTAKVVGGAIREAIRSGFLSSLGGLLVRGRLAGIRERLDPNAVGGAILLGLRHPVVIAHGASSAEGVAQAIRLARRAADEGVVDRTSAALEAAGALRSASAASVAGQS
jgi:phosphate acyltransferase